MIITRFHDLETIELELEFLTPCFLGGADGNAELRSAPFKNLLRQWWRVVNGCLDSAKLLEKESELFGSVGSNGSSDAHRSLLTIAMNSTKEFEKQVTSAYSKFEASIAIEKVNGKKQPIKPLSYLGYGPIDRGKWKKFITPEEKIGLEISFPSSYRTEIEKTVQLLNVFGSVGSRSRNGWGALKITSKDIEVQKVDWLTPVPFEKSIESKKYPWTLASDSKGLLCWESTGCNSWEEVMKKIAKIYATLRYNTIAMKDIDSRVILGFPLTKSRIRETSIERAPKQLRMTVSKKTDGKLYGMFYHLPYSLPFTLSNEKSPSDLWKSVHAFLDQSTDLKRSNILGEK